jgi:hypothetical protein
VPAEPWQLPVDVAELLELVFKRLEADVGDWRIEAFATNGDLRTWKRSEEGGRKVLARFDLEPRREQ